MRETYDLTIEDAGMYHAKIVRNVVAEQKEALQQDQSQSETTVVVQAPVANLPNAVQNTQQQLSTQLHKMQVMMQAIHM